MLKVSKSQKKRGVLNSSKKRTKLTILSIFFLANMLRVVSFVCFFRRIEKTINCFQDLLTFKKIIKNSWKLHERSRLEVLKLVVTSDEQDNGVGEIPKSFGQKTRQNAAPVFSDALAFDPVTIDDLNHLEHFIFRTIHILRKHI